MGSALSYFSSGNNDAKQDPPTATGNATAMDVTDETPVVPNTTQTSDARELKIEFKMSHEERQKLTIMAAQVKAVMDDLRVAAPWVDGQKGADLRSMGTTTELEESARMFEGIGVIEKILRQEQITQSELLTLMVMIDKLKPEKEKEEKEKDVEPTEYAIANLLPQWNMTKEQIISMPFFDLAVFKYRLDLWNAWISGEKHTEYYYDIKNRPENEKKEYELHQLSHASMPWVKSATKLLENPQMWVSRVEFNPLPDDSKDLQSCRAVSTLLSNLYMAYYTKIMENPDGPRTGFELRLIGKKKEMFDKYAKPLGFEKSNVSGDVCILVPV